MGNTQFEVLPERSLTLVGRCYVTDPCYFVPDDMWGDLCDVWFADANNDLSQGCIVRIKGAEILVTRTRHGDGSYKVKGAGEFCVDSGTFAIVQVDQLEAVGLQHEEHCATYITFAAPVVVHVNGAGNMFAGMDILVDTVSDPVDEYDEYEGADYDDEDEE